MAAPQRRPTDRYRTYVKKSDKLTPRVSIRRFHDIFSAGFTWIHLDSPGFTWIHLDSPGFTWIHLDSPGFTWIYLEFF